MDTKNIAKEIYDELGMDGIYKEEKTISRIKSVLDKYDTGLKNESCGCDINKSLRVGVKDYCTTCIPDEEITMAVHSNFLSEMNYIFSE